MYRRSGIISFAALSSLLLCGATSPSGCTSSPSGTIGPSKGEVYGAAAGIIAVALVGTVVLVEVHKSHHTIKGCVTTGPDGLELRNEGNQKTYALTGVTANVKVGDVIKVHGDKVKNQKDSAGDQDFMVVKMSRDYGACKADLNPPVKRTTSAKTP